MRSGLALLICLLAACGSKKEAGPQGEPSAGEPSAGGAPDTPPPPAPLRPLGLTSVGAHGYQWGKGADAFEKTAAAYKAKDWPALQAACAETLKLDPTHLRAHRLLSTALAAQSSFDEAADHLETAIAGDWLLFAPGVEADPDLASLWAAPAGARLAAALPRYRDAFQQAARAGLKVVARRGKLKLAEGAGAQRVSQRAELYAYDLAGKRWLRLTHTDDKVVAWLAAPSGDELAYVTYSRVAVPAAPGQPVLLTDARVSTLNLVALAPSAKDPKLEPVRAVELTYLTGDQLVATTYDPAQSWTIDFTTGKKSKTATPTELGARVTVSYGGVALESGADPGVEAEWRAGPNGALVADKLGLPGGVAVELPAGALVDRASIAWSPGRKRLAFATAADPCSVDPAAGQASLYAVEAAGGKLKFVLKAASPRVHNEAREGIG